MLRVARLKYKTKYKSWTKYVSLANFLRINGMTVSCEEIPSKDQILLKDEI